MRVVVAFVMFPAGLVLRFFALRVHGSCNFVHLFAHDVGDVYVGVGADHGFHAIICGTVFPHNRFRVFTVFPFFGDDLEACSLP